MRVRIIQIFCQSKCHDMFVVQRWLSEAHTRYIAEAPVGNVHKLSKEPEHWEAVRDFELDEYDKACAFATDLSMTKRPVTELAIFENGALTKTEVAQPPP